MANLGYTQAQWTRFWRELATGILAPMRCVRELRDRFRFERVQVVNENDATSATAHFTSVVLTGIDVTANVDPTGRLFVRITANGANWDVKLSKATGGGAGDVVAQVLNLAASATGTLVAQNSSGVGGTVTLGATIAAETNDRHALRVHVDWPAVLKTIWTGTASVEDDEASRSAAKAAYDVVAARLDEADAALRTLAERWGLADVARGNPEARGNQFLKSAETLLYSDVEKPDGSGNVVRERAGLFLRLSRAMADETTGGQQDVKRRVTAAGAGTFQGGNAGKGTVAAHTPGEACPASRWRFVCDRGVDTGDLGAEHFRVEVAFTAPNDDRTARVADGPTVKKAWSGPFGFGPITLTRTYAKTGDATNIHFAAASSVSVSGEKSANTDAGTLYWKVVANGANWDFEFYSDSARTALKAKATNAATGAAFTASEQNSSGLSIVWTAGTGPTNGATGTLLLQPFKLENVIGTDRVPDEFEVVVTESAGPGLIQKTIADEWGVALSSDVPGGESIPDSLMQTNTFVPYVVEAN